MHSGSGRASKEVVAQAGYALSPGRFVGVEEVEDDGVPVEEKIERLNASVREALQKREHLSRVILDAMDALEAEM